GLSGVNYIDFGRTRQRPKPATGVFVASRFLPIDNVLGWDRPTGNLRADADFHHVAFVYDAIRKELRHYFDGKLQFTASGMWKEVTTTGPEQQAAVFPPHYPMLQIGMRDGIQQWSHRTLGGRREEMKKFQGFLDEMRLSNQALYASDFQPPACFVGPWIIARPERVELASVEGHVPVL